MGRSYNINKKEKITETEQYLAHVVYKTGRKQFLGEHLGNVAEFAEQICTLSELKNIKTDPKVEYIFKENESGASRGLLCALDIYNKITEYDLTKGDIISGTGSINQNGIVGSIDGVKYKLAGAVKKHAKVFIVPTDNYKEALYEKEKNNYEIELIEADTLHNVIEKLKER